MGQLLIWHKSIKKWSFHVAADYLFLGTVDLEKGNAESARLLFKKSLSLKSSVHAARNLAIFAPTKQEAIAYYQLGLESMGKSLDPKIDPAVERLGADLVSEFAGWLIGNKEWNELKALLKDLKTNRSNSSMALASYANGFLSQDKLLHAEACVAIQDNNYTSAIAILTSNCFPTYGSLRNDLIELWYEKELAESRSRKKGSPLSMLETVHLRRDLGCGGDHETTINLKGNCIRGPPNLGYAYGRL